MNLFLAVCGPDAPRLEHVARQELLRAASAFPALSGRPAPVERSKAETVVFLSVSPSRAVSRRRYGSGENGQVVSYDGRPLSPTGMASEDARGLAHRFDALHEDLEGAFVVLRLAKAVDRLDVLTDPLGNLPVYCGALPSGGRIVSNSLAALAGVARLTDLDATGVATFLTLGFYGEWRTPLRGVSVLRGGARFSFYGDGRTSEHAYFGPETLAQQEDAPAIDELIEDLTGLVRSAGDSLRLGLTAGRDSRVCLALALRAGVDVAAYTEGHPGMFDVDAAGQLARRMGIPHTTVMRPDLRDLDVGELILSFVGQGDCTSSFGQLADHLTQLDPPTTLAVKLTGLGGEVARANTHPVRAFLLCGEPMSRLTWVQRELSRKKISGFGGLVGDNCRDLASDYIRRCFEQRSREAVPRRLLAESLYVFDAMVRVHNGAVRRTAGTADLVFPLSSRPFLRFAWSRSLRERFSEGVHRTILERLEPRLLAPPLDTPWPRNAPRAVSGRVAWNLLRLSYTARGGPRGNALSLDSGFWSAQRQRHQAFVASLADSPLFSFVDRAQLLRELDGEAHPSSGAMRALSILWWLHGRVRNADLTDDLLGGVRTQQQETPLETPSD